MSDRLNERQKRFCEIRVANPRASDADVYRQAGYKPKNDNAAAAAASRLLKDVKVQVYIHQLRRAAREAIVAQAATWEEMLLDARDYLQGVLEDRYPADSDKIRTAMYVADRVEGRPRQSIAVTHSSMAEALKEIEAEIAERDKAPQQPTVH